MGLGPGQVGEMDRNGQCEILSKVPQQNGQNMPMDSVLENVRRGQKTGEIGMVQVFDVSNQAGGGSTAELED